MTPAHVEAEKNTKNVTVSSGDFVIPGFRAAAAASGMRYQGRNDVALIVTENGEPATASGVFTLNRFTAAPVILCRERLAAGGIRGILANAGIANACTGDEGIARAKEMAKAAAESLNVPEESLLVASTGVIGQQLVVEPAAAVMPDLASKLRPEGWKDAARAIMTTDTVPKMASARVEIDGVPVTVGGIAKGSGMIAPNMATLLVFVATDAAIEGEALDHWTRRGAERSFNGITVDGDTSTNDTLLVLASGRAGNPVIADTESAGSRAFGAALHAVLLELARKVVVDGEGATKFIEMEVVGAASEADARAIALTIANSPLVKTAFFGEDANWGRIVAAAGRAGVPLDPEKATLYFDDFCVFLEGTPILGPEIEERASQIFRQKEIHIRLELGMGRESYTAYTCDFSYDYVKINASYRS